jgi:hypothetical protein
MSWLRLDENYADRLAAFRWEATAIWPIVAVLLKRGRGVIEDSALNPVSIKLEWNGIPERVIERGLKELKDGGLLKLGSKVLKRGRGSRTVRGWLCDLEVKPDPRPMASRRQTLIPGLKTVENDSSQGLKPPSVDKLVNPPHSQLFFSPQGFNPRDKSLNPRDKSQGLKQGHGITGELRLPSRARARIPQFLLVKEENSKKGMWETYRSLNPGARPLPPKAWSSVTNRLLKEFSEDDISLVLRWAALAPDYDWHRRRGLTTFDAVLSSSKFAARLEKARRWQVTGAAVGSPVETLSEFHQLTDEDKEELSSWGAQLQQDWAELVDAGWSGPSAMLELEHLR